MERLPTVLAIDDDKISQKFIARSVAHSFHLHSAYTGEEGLALAASIQPDLILLDVEMPGLNGYEVCDQLRQNTITANTPIIFASSRSSLRERMLGFEAGGDDYLVKPFAPEELLAKLNVLLKFRTTQQKLKQQVSQAEETAYTALTGSSELGLAMSFVEQSYSAFNYEVLAFRLFSVTSTLGLNCTLLILNGDEKNYYASSGTINPLESDVMAMLRKDQRFIDFGCRTQVNFNNLSLLIKNMPLNDMERYGRIKDLAPAILGAADAKIHALNTQAAIAKQSGTLVASFNEIKTTLISLAHALHSNQQKGAQVMRTMLNELEFSLPSMGLEDDQERYIVDLIDNSIVETLTVTDTTDSIGQSFTNVANQLETLIEKQKGFVLSLAPKPLEEPTNQDHEQADPGSMDIELF